MSAPRARFRAPKVVLTAVLALVVAALAVAIPATQAAPAHKAKTAKGTIKGDTSAKSGPNCDADACKALVNGDATMSWNTAHVIFAGTLKGKATEVYTAASFTDKHTELWGTGKFEGTYRGRSGVATYTFSGKGTTAVGGPITFVSGTGGLAGLRGTIIWAPKKDGSFTYKGKLKIV
jgi:hypothetical protein